MQFAAGERMARQAHPNLALETHRGRVPFDVVEPLRRLSMISHGAISILLDISQITNGTASSIAPAEPVTSCCCPRPTDSRRPE
jgi:hypothetical protein